jgi:SAM-dependent methyltransferase
MLKYKNQFELDDARTTLLHRQIILNKPFLKKIYEHWYRIFVKQSALLPPGPLLEIGSGGGFIQEVMPGVITSDILSLEHCDKCFSADKLPFQNDELSGIFMINVFHHLPKPADFLKEANRTLKSNARIVMIEPANSIWGRFIYRNFHHEPFEPKAGWEIDSTGPLSGANGALPWIIFERDKSLFEKQFPGLELQSIKFEMPFMYLVSGGVSRRALVPLWAFNFIRGAEKLLSPVSKYLSMFQVIVIRKK